MLFSMILYKGLPAFTQATATLEVYFDPEVIKVKDAPVRQAGQSDAEFQKAINGWQRQVTMLNWNKLIEASLAKAGPNMQIDTRSALSIIETSERFKLRDMFVADPTLRGKTATVDLLASANADNWLKGNIDRSLPDTQQQLSPSARALADQLLAEGQIDFS